MTPGARKVLTIERDPERLAEIVATLAVQTAEQSAHIRALEQALSPGYVRRPTAPRIECKNLVPGHTVWLTEAQKAALEKGARP